MRWNRRLLLGGWIAAAALAIEASPARTAASDPPEPQPLAPGAKVVTLWPKGSPMLKEMAGSDKPEVVYLSKGSEPRILHVDNIHNPSLSVHLAPADKANGMAVIVAAGGGNKT